MKTLDPDEFLVWAAERGIGLDERYDEPRCLVYRPYRAISRFWPIPPRVSGWPTFVERLLEASGPWTTCRLWLRGGRWPDQVKHDFTDANESVRAAVLRAFRIESRHHGAIEWDRSEHERIITLVFLQLTLGWTSYDDLFIVPDHGRLFLHVDPHGVVHAEFERKQHIKPFVGHMENGGYQLPTVLPDATFKRPRWMKTARPGPDQAG